jgi:radical SAM superfamily enzyme YgiQ (UPF0313 family)
MKIVLCTTPIRPVPTDYPPFGSLALVQSLRLAGYDPYFYDIDALRPSFDEVVRFYRERKPDLIAISAVVSTAYAYTKQLCRALKKELPATPIVVGGNLAASAELLHRLCGVDICVAGEGEQAIVELTRFFEQKPGLPLDVEALRKVKGLSFLDRAGEMVFTDYDLPIPVEDFLDPDYSILEHYSKIDNFIRDPLARSDFARDPRSYEPHRKGQKVATVVSTKGCVARCTFCHRWDKGYRHLDPSAIVRRMEYLRERYNVGFFQFGDENFGSDRKKLDEFIRLVKPMNVLFEAAGIRCRSVDLDVLRRLRDAGCVAVYYGIESGSQRILDVMEKNATVEINLNAARWTREAGLYTIYQLVLAMPGETSDTVRETIEFINRVTEASPEPPHKILSINYIQALPGTPVYEYARRKTGMGSSLAAEDHYLTQVSDIDAADDGKFINFTQESTFTVKSWRHRILFEAEANWYRQRGWSPEEFKLPSGVEVRERDYYREGGYFNLKRVVSQPAFYRYFWPFRSLYFYAYVAVKDLVRLPQRQFWRHVGEFLLGLVRKRPALDDYRSLRRIMKEDTPGPASQTEQSMLPLRLGR